VKTPAAIHVPMASYSIWSGFASLVIIIISSWTYFVSDLIRNEMLFFMVLGLFHAIFAIWFWQGKKSGPFIYLTVFTRLLTACIYGVSAWQLFTRGESLALSDSLLMGYLIYLVVQGSADMLGAMASIGLLRMNKQPLLQTKRIKTAVKAGLEIKNRFAFALYMLILGAWILLSTGSFLSFLHLPKTVFALSGSAQESVPGPVHLVGLFVLLLAAYNLVAVKYRIMPLITAGIRGGLMTCAFVLVLVLTEILHPITLLLPAVDLVSVGAILLLRLFRMIKRTRVA